MQLEIYKDVVVHGSWEKRIGIPGPHGRNKLAAGYGAGLGPGEIVPHVETEKNTDNAFPFDSKSAQPARWKRCAEVVKGSLRNLVHEWRNRQPVGGCHLDSMQLCTR